jgi:hypothetical protein
MRLQDDLKDYSLALHTIDIILELCSKGTHQEKFLK